MPTSGSSPTFYDFKELVLLTLGEIPVIGGEGVIESMRAGRSAYNEPLLYEATVGAIAAVQPWIPFTVLTEFSSDGVNNTFALPYNVYKIEAVQDQTTGQYLERFVPGPGKTRSAQQNTVDWIEYPRGTLWLSKTMTVGRTFWLYYQANYPVPADETDDEFVMPFPRSALIGAAYWACAHCVIPGSIAEAQIAQFKTRIDSGSPIDNPLEQSAKFFRALFLDEMGRLPKYTGANF